MTVTEIADIIEQAESTPLSPPWQQPDFSYLIDAATGEIGRVVSSEKEPAGAHEFFFWASDAALTLDVGHIVVAFSEEAAIIGVVDQPRRYSDLRTFLDDYFDRHIELGMADETATKRPEILVFTVNVLASRHLRSDVQSHRPAINGPVYFATPEAIAYALNVEKFTGVPIPALMHTNGNYERTSDGETVLDEEGNERFQRTPLYLDEDYLLGPEAGHANWTGQSGLATKTSHALFLISSVFQTLEKSSEPKSVAALMFNVKGPDLLWLDKPAQPAEGMEEVYHQSGGNGLNKDHIDAYASLDMKPRAFENLRIFAPFRPNNAPNGYSGKISLAAFREHNRLNTVRHQPGETDCVFPILWSLQTALSFPHRLFDGNDLDDKLSGFIYELRELKIDSMVGLNALFQKIEDHFEESGEEYWNGHHKATIRKAKNRFRGLQSKLGGLLADGVVDYGNQPQVTHQFSNHELRVVDISQCNTTAQELIVTSTINEIWRLAEDSKMGVDKLIVFVDELNKYAPAGGEGGLRDTLVDIAARGRHLNVVLLGAEQFRSKVDSEILGNCGTSFYGRIGDEEITNNAYRSITETTKAELLGLPKGRMLVRHAHFRAPLFGTFPLPPTIPGVVGQRVFGGEERRQDPADGLYHTIANLLKGTPQQSKAPSLSEVRTVCDGLDSQDIDKIASDIQRTYGTLAKQNGRADPWGNAKRQLDRYRSQVNQS
jgi:hypothetical protein